MKQGRIKGNRLPPRWNPENNDNAKAMNRLAMLLAPHGHVGEAIEWLQKAMELSRTTCCAQKPCLDLCHMPDRRYRNGPKAVELARPRMRTDELVQRPIPPCWPTRTMKPANGRKRSNNFARPPS